MNTWHGVCILLIAVSSVMKCCWSTSAPSMRRIVERMVGRASPPQQAKLLAGDPGLAAAARTGHSRGQTGVPSDGSLSLGWKLRVQRLMQKHGIQARGKRKFRVTTTDSRHELPIAPNLLDRIFTVAEPNLVWVGDFTYSTPSQRNSIERRCAA